jgi:hypothetical protein
MALCHPSLDARPTPQSTEVEYADVEPGKHQVFCAASPGGAKVLAGEIVIKPGKRVEKTVRWNEGKPSLSEGRPRF